MIELRHLRYFIAVAEELNFRRAAERVHIDQTPLSRSIRDLEDRWGVTLFIRTPRQLQLTPAGGKLLEQARRLFVRLERAKRVVRATDTRHREPLRVGADDTIVQPQIAECLRSWGHAAPDIPVEFTECHTTELVSALQGEVVDACFSFGVPDQDSISQYPVWKSLMVAILSTEHELAVRERVSLAELLSFPAIACTEAGHPGLHRQMSHILSQYALSPTIVGEARTLPGYLTRVAAGLGVGLADATHMQSVQRRDIVVLPLFEKIHITTYLLHKKRSGELPQILQRFLTHATTLC